MIQLGIIFLAAVFFIVFERVLPGRHLPNPPGWFARAALLNGIQLGIVVLAGFTWNRWFTGWSLFHMAGHLPGPVEGAFAWFVGTFVFYWWHRVRHAIGYRMACSAPSASQSGANRGDYIVLQTST